MTSRLIIVILGLIFFSFGFYLLSYQKNFSEQKTLNLQLAEDTLKAHQASLHTDENTLREGSASVAKVEVMDMNNPTIKRGHEIYHQVGQCVTCHGEEGQGIVEKQAPLLAGQAEWYVVSQLNAFKNGLRKNEAMMPFLKDLTEQDFKDVAEYIKLLRVTAKP